MIVLYLKDSNQFLQAIKGFPEVKEEDNKLLFADGKVIINDLTKAGWKIYPDQEIVIPTEWDEEMDMPVETFVTVEELNLVEFVPGEPTPYDDHIRAREIVDGNPANIPAVEVWELFDIIARKLFP